MVNITIYAMWQDISHSSAWHILYKTSPKELAFPKSKPVHSAAGSHLYGKKRERTIITKPKAIDIHTHIIVILLDEWSVFNSGQPIYIRVWWAHCLQFWTNAYTLGCDWPLGCQLWSARRGNFSFSWFLNAFEERSWGGMLMLWILLWIDSYGFHDFANQG